MTEPIDTGTSAYKSTLLHVTECASGGVTRALELAVKATPEIEHVVMAPVGAIRTDELGVRHVPLPHGTWARTRGIGRVVGEVGASAVHAHSSRAGVYARLAKLDVPILYQPHCYAFSDVTKPSIVRAAYWLVERILTRRTSAVLALTAHEERQARRLGVRNVHRIVNAPTITREGREARRAATTIKTVVMVGRVSPQKDPRFFAAVAEAFRSDPSVRFAWLGDVPSGGGDRRGLAALRNAGVEITGWLGDGELTRRLADADLYLHSAAYEGFPLSLLDAGELGVAIIVRSIPALADCGLPQFETPEEAARLVAWLLTDAGARRDLERRSTALSCHMGIDAHNASLSHAYARHGLVRSLR